MLGKETPIPRARAYFAYVTRSKLLSARRFSTQSVKGAPQFFRYSARKKYTLHNSNLPRSCSLESEMLIARYFLRLGMRASPAFDAVFGQIASYYMLILFENGKTAIFVQRQGKSNFTSTSVQCAVCKTAIFGC